MMTEEDLSIDDVNVQTIGVGAIVQALQNGEVDAIVFSRLRYYALQAAGFDVGQILSDEYLPSFGNVLVTSPPEGRGRAARSSDGFAEALDQWHRVRDRQPRRRGDDGRRRTTPPSSRARRPAVTVGHRGPLHPRRCGSRRPPRRTVSATATSSAGRPSIDAQVDYGLIPDDFDAEDMVRQPGDS